MQAKSGGWSPNRFLIGDANVAERFSSFQNILQKCMLVHRELHQGDTRKQPHHFKACNMKRVNNPSKYLKGIVKEDSNYYVGFGIKNLTELGKNHPDIQDLLKGIKSSVVVSGKSGPLRDNVQGKYRKRQPGVKTSVWKHIEYYSHKWEKIIMYDREYSIWEKELLHLFKLELRVAKTPQNEIVFYFPRLTMKDDEQHYLKAGAAMNMSYALSNYFGMYDTGFNPIIPVTKYEDRSLLPAGMTNRTVKEKLEEIERRINAESNVESTGNSYRFALLKEKTPSNVTIGIGGFDE